MALANFQISLQAQLGLGVSHNFLLLHPLPPVFFRTNSIFQTPKPSLLRPSPFTHGHNLLSSVSEQGVPPSGLRTICLCPLSIILPTTLKALLFPLSHILFF